MPLWHSLVPGKDTQASSGTRTSLTIVTWRFTQAYRPCFSTEPLSLFKAPSWHDYIALPAFVLVHLGLAGVSISFFHLNSYLVFSCPCSTHSSPYLSTDLLCFAFFPLHFDSSIIAPSISMPFPFSTSIWHCLEAELTG